jgi:uncharacterized membrane protein YdbT with pleckstrin-like domain
MRRTHPYAVWGFLPRFAPLLLIALLEQLVFRPQGFWARAAALGGNLLAAALVLLWAVLEYRAIGYHADEDTLFLRRGLLYRRTAQVPYDRICTMTIRQNLLPTLFGAARLYLDTPAGSHRSADFSLVLKRKPLDKIADSIFPSPRTKPVYRAGAWRVALMAASWSNPGAGWLLLAPFINRLGAVLGAEISERLYATVDVSMRLAAYGIPPAAAALGWVLFFGWAAAALVQLFRYGNFSVSADEESLCIRRGVLNTSTRVIRRSRICAFSIQQSLFMRAMRLYSAHVHSVGTGKDKSDRSLLVAAAGQRELAAALRSMTALPLDHGVRVRPPKRALKSYLLLPGTFICLLLLLIAAQGMLRGRLIPLIAAFIAPLLAWWLLFRIEAHRTAGLSLQKGCLILSGYHKLNLYRFTVPIAAVQLVSLRQNPLQKHSGLCSVRVTLYGEGQRPVNVKQLPHEEVLQLLQEAALR